MPDYKRPTVEDEAAPPGDGVTERRWVFFRRQSGPHSQTRRASPYPSTPRERTSIQPTSPSSAARSQTQSATTLPKITPLLTTSEALSIVRSDRVTHIDYLYARVVLFGASLGKFDTAFLSRRKLAFHEALDQLCQWENRDGNGPTDFKRVASQFLRTIEIEYVYLLRKLNHLVDGYIMDFDYAVRHRNRPVPSPASSVFSAQASQVFSSLQEDPVWVQSTNGITSTLFDSALSVINQTNETVLLYKQNLQNALLAYVCDQAMPTLLSGEQRQAAESLRQWNCIPTFKGVGAGFLVAEEIQLNSA